VRSGEGLFLDTRGLEEVAAAHTEPANLAEVRQLAIDPGFVVMPRVNSDKQPGICSPASRSPVERREFAPACFLINRRPV
jgi:hypothetical protein